jgi:hypothetical protein
VQRWLSGGRARSGPGVDQSNDAIPGTFIDDGT